MAHIPIVGMGAVCTAGYGVQKGYSIVKKGQDGLKPLSLFDSELKEVPLVGQIDISPEEILGHEVPNRSTGLALCAINEALALFPNRDKLRLGIVLATTVAGVSRSELFYRSFRQKPEYASKAALELAYHEPTAMAGYIANKIKAQGFQSLSTACSTSLHALGMAKRLIEQDEYDLCLAIGVDALSLLTLRGFASLMLIDFKGCKPFDQHRIGISLGEGAGVMLLASKKVAEKSGIKPIATVSGWGASADCHHMTAPHPEGEGAIRAISQAMNEADISPEEIDMITGHATATPDNDVSEIKALRSIFNPMPPIISMKRSLGHTLAASGTLEAVFTVCALEDNYIPATAGFSVIDKNIGITPSPGVKKPLKHILKNAFGFGGNNGAVIISKAEK